MERTRNGELAWGRYELQSELGRGGMGKVWLARDVRLDRQVALKELAPRFAKDETFVSRFLTEARAAARLNHPAIVQIYDFGNDHTGYFLAMEYVNGVSLGALLQQRGFLREAKAISLVRQACEALAVAHRAGIVHRDVKPDNMMVTSSGAFKMVDLGLAKRIDDDHSQTGTGMTMGSPYYISPEQIRSAKTIDHRTDIYSLGATLYHLTTGQLPYDGSSGPHIMSRHLTDELPDPKSHRPELSDGICRIIRAMMAKDPEERYQAVSVVEEDLARLARGAGPEVEEPSDSVVSVGPSVPLSDSEVHDVELIQRIEQEMMAAVGPFGGVLVKKSASWAPTFDALCESLASEIENEDRRRVFVERCRKHRAKIATGPETPTEVALDLAEETTTIDVEAPIVTPLAEGVTEGQRIRIEAELIRRVGPLGKILVTRAVKDAASPEELGRVVAEHIPDESGRAAFLRFVADLRD
jgi:serine/threonine-protein kinase